MKQKLCLIGAVLLAIFTGFAVAQVPALFVASPTGLEQINVLGTGPQIETIRIAQVRDATGYKLVATGSTVATTPLNTVSKLLATGAITTWNITFPASPWDGENLEVGCPGGDTTTVSMSATSPAAAVGAAFTSCTAATPTYAQWVYNLSGNTWYRVH